MHRCLELARLGGRDVGLNPQVGSVLVRNGEIIAEGYHHGYGQHHAERDLLENYSGSVELEDILYANLEPCSHHGKTHACTDIITQRGVQTVVYGMKDVNHLVDGLSKLEAAGVTVLGPVLSEQCRRFNRGFISVQEQHRPYITLKQAQTTEGRFASDDGSPLHITSQEQNEWSHRHLRATHDAIVVGVQTIINDDPQLTTRIATSDQVNLNNYRIILDPTLRIPLEANVVNDDLAAKTIIVTATKSDATAELESRGVVIWQVSETEAGLDLNQVWEKCLTATDDFHGICSILVEGGPTTWKSFKNQSYVDEEVVLVG